MYSASAAALPARTAARAIKLESVVPAVVPQHIPALRCKQACRIRLLSALAALSALVPEPAEAVAARHISIIQAFTTPMAAHLPLVVPVAAGEENPQAVTVQRADRMEAMEVVQARGQAARVREQRRASSGSHPALYTLAAAEEAAIAGIPAVTAAPVAAEAALGQPTRAAAAPEELQPVRLGAPEIQAAAASWSSATTARRKEDI